jgi:hypothetical protein
MKPFFLLMAMLLFLPLNGFAADVRAAVDRNRIDPGESVLLTVTISDGDGDVDVSGIRDFEVASRGSSTSVRIVNGNMSKETCYDFTLIPLKKGLLKIPPLAVQLGNDRLLTQEIQVEVSGTSKQADASRDVFVSATVSSLNPYEGEQVFYSFKVFHTVQITDAGFQQPAFDGFTVKKIEPDKTYKTIVSGREYGVVELKFVLIPVKSGMLTLEPAVLKCNMVQPGKRRRGSYDTFFDDPFFGRAQLEPGIFSSPEFKMNIKPLPSYPHDVPFSGLVGNFDFKASLDKQNVEAGDSATLSLTVSGKGNIMDAPEPQVNLKGPFKVYKDNPEEEIKLDENGYSGKKIFRMALVPVRAGDFTIGPFRYSYFNVQTGQYELMTAPELLISGKPSIEKEKTEVFSSQPENPLPTPKKEEVRFTGRDILPLKEGVDALETIRPMRFSCFLFYWMAPLCLYLPVKLYFKVFRKEVDIKTTMAQRAAAALKKARKSIHTDEDFYSGLYTALVSMVLSAGSTRGESLTLSEVKDILNSKGHTEETAFEAAELLAGIESSRYGGRKCDEKEKEALFSRTKSFLRRLS